ncbi:hypothetical protein WJX75_008044 [Coccomyxa subellipsoidea]|uniref:Uncharacterized protein n=1 Tax=Coccomyxa subellipsoidea TaxID=248742 RepID=A0ABR2YML3_9CHLO
MALSRLASPLLTWAENGQASEELLQDLRFYDDVRLEEAIVSFIERLSRPAIFLCDELQALLAAKDLMPVLHKLTSKAQKDLLRLAKGDGMPVGALDHTVYQLTEPHLTSNDETAPDGNRIVHLHAPWHAALIMAMFTENGDLKTHPHGTFQLPSSQQRSAMLKRSASAAQLEDN